MKYIVKDKNNKKVAEFQKKKDAQSLIDIRQNEGYTLEVLDEKEERHLKLQKAFESAWKDDDTSLSIMSKALAYYIWRYQVEDLHSKYNTDNEEMKQCNIEASNRARLFFEHILPDADLFRIWASMEANFCSEWYEPEITEKEDDLLKVYKRMQSIYHELSEKGEKIEKKS